MNLLSLNIIPEAYETRFRMRRTYVTARHLMLLLIIYLLFLGTVLLAARLILQREFTRIVNETSLVTADNRILEKKVEEMNDYIKDISVAEKKHEQWAPFLIKLSSAIPNGVILNTISIDEDKKTTIAGQANTRNDLLSLKENLEALSGISGITLPLDDLVYPVDVPFKIEFTIDSDALNYTAL